MGTIGRTIVSLQPVGNSMCGEVSLRGSDHFITSLAFEFVDFKVPGIVIFWAEVVSVFKIENTISYSFLRTVWNFVRAR